MKTVAIIGAGFAGLAAAYFLSKSFQVTVFDQKGIGGGASGISSGLLHPYPGEKGRRSWHADAALAAANELLNVAEQEMSSPVAHRGGILRIGDCTSPGSDVELQGDGSYLIRSGITVFPTIYLEGLWKACEKRGSALVLNKIDALKELEHFDVVVVAAGGGLRMFPECSSLAVNFVKGQVLTCALKKPLERSVSAKRYQALTFEPDRYHLGATYERDFTDGAPCLEIAVNLLQPETAVYDCRAGVRVTNPAHYFPILEQVNAKTWVMTAFGSRGLLYHAYFGQKIGRAL